MSTRRYAATNARIRGMIAGLLSAPEKRSLLDAADPADALRQLASTPYAADLARRMGDGGRLLTVQKALERNLVTAYDHVLRTLEGCPRLLVEGMLQRLEVDNLKVILRGLATGRDPAEISALLLPLDSHGHLPVDALLAAADVTAAIDALGRSPYAGVLREGLARYRREQSLFPLEVALDLEYYRRLWSSAEALPRGDRTRAVRFLGAQYDVINVDWLLRYKVIYHLSAVEIFNYTLPHGWRIDDRAIRRASEAADLAGVIAALPDPYQGLLRPRITDNQIGLLEVALNHYLSAEAKGMLAGYPFHIGVVLAYLWLKKAEVHDLAAILEGKRYGRSPDEIEAFLWGGL